MANMNICLKTLANTCACLTLHNRYLSYKTDPCFTEKGICLYQTELNRASNEASVYVCLSLYAVISQPWLKAVQTHLCFNITKKGHLIGQDWYNRILKNTIKLYQGLSKHPRDKSEKNDCVFLGPFWCNIKVDPER